MSRTALQESGLVARNVQKRKEIKQWGIIILWVGSYYNLSGGVEIPYPFGMTDPNCYVDWWFEIECRNQLHFGLLSFLPFTSLKHRRTSSFTTTLSSVQRLEDKLNILERTFQSNLPTIQSILEFQLVSGQPFFIIAIDDGNCLNWRHSQHATWYNQSTRLLFIGGRVSGSASPSYQRFKFGVPRGWSWQRSDPSSNTVELGRPSNSFR